MKRIAGVLAIALLTGGCYHATIVTGKPASGETISNPWAHSFIAGLVPPKIVETAAQCPNGVARVETQHSFLNMLAQFVTFSLYSPMTIEATCASGEDMDVEPVQTPEELGRALESGEAFYLKVPTG